MKLHHTILFFLITLSLSLPKAQAQTEKEIVDFLHSATLKTDNKTVKIPIEIKNDLILLKVKVNGKDATFMWDNGFSFSGIDNSLVDQFKFVPYGGNAESVTATDGNNVQVNLNFIVCPKMEIGGISVLNSPFLKVDFKSISQTKELMFQGILGAAVINKLNWKFDFDNNFVEISEKPFTVNNNDLVLPYRIIETNANHYMPIALNGNKIETLVDFGFNNDIIEVNTSNAHFFAKSDATKAFGPSSISVGGLAPVDTIYTIKDGFSFELSGKKLAVQPKISFTKAVNNIIIGNKIFRDNYNVIINTSGNTVYVLSSRKKPAPAIGNEVYGYRVHYIEGKLKIMSIDANANTVNSDIKLMDEVVSINGKVPADFGDNYTLRMYQQNLLKDQKKLILKLKNGKEISLTPQPKTEYKFTNEKELWAMPK